MGFISWIESFLFETIHGVVILVAPLFGVAWILNKIFLGSKVPYYIAGILAFCIFFSVPTIPRILFEKRTLEKAENAPGIQLVNKTRLGSLVEPLTWFHSPFGHFRFVGPYSHWEDITGEVRTFREVIYRYEEEPQIFIIQVFCKEGEYGIGTPDEAGKVRYLSNRWEKLSKENIVLFCDRDWTKEKNELRQAVLKQTTQ